LDPSFLVSLYNIAKVQLVVIDSLGEDQKATLEIAKLIKDESLRT
jgi:pyruvate/2-oxoglutarate dehydrogenase complex dihydrolipoamide acyltransferase (E2) component